MEAKKKKEGVVSTTSGEDVSEEGITSGTDLSEAAAKLLELKEQKISQKIVSVWEVNVGGLFRNITTRLLIDGGTICSTMPRRRSRRHLSKQRHSKRRG